MSLQPISLVSEIEQYINLGKDTNAPLTTSLTWSGATHTILKRTPPAALGLPSGTQWAEDTPTGLGDKDTILILGPANDTQYVRHFAWRNLRKFTLDKATFNLGLTHNVSAHVDGNTNFTSFDLLFRQYNSGRPKDIISAQNILTGHAAIGTTDLGAQTFIYEESFSPNAIIEADSFIVVSITMNTTDGGGTSTSQEGLLPAFPYSKTNTLKWFSQSGVYLLGRGLQ